MDIYVQMVMFNKLGSSFSLWEIAEQRKIPLVKIGVRAMMGMSNKFWNFLATKSLLALIIENFWEFLKSKF